MNWSFSRFWDADGAADHRTPACCVKNREGVEYPWPYPKKVNRFDLICAESSPPLDNIKGKDPFAQNVPGAQTGQLNSMRSSDA
jgi:hypothetical protein